MGGLKTKKMTIGELLLVIIAVLSYISLHVGYKKSKTSVNKYIFNRGFGSYWWVVIRVLYIVIVFITLSVQWINLINWDFLNYKLF